MGYYNKSIITQLKMIQYLVLAVIAFQFGLDWYSAVMLILYLLVSLIELTSRDNNLEF